MNPSDGSRCSFGILGATSMILAFAVLAGAFLPGLVAEDRSPDVHTGPGIEPLVKIQYGLLQNNSWTNVSGGFPPPGMNQVGLVYDSKNDRIILFGGWDGKWIHNDTWSYDYENNGWLNMTPIRSPPRFNLFTMAYDVESDRTMLFGGRFGILGESNETWAYDYVANTWTNMSPSIAPTPRHSSGMAYDIESDRIVLFGGCLNPDSICTKFNNETWTYDYNTNTWANMTSGLEPNPRSGLRMVYDDRHDRIILFSGYGGNLFKSDTYTYDYDSNRWRNMTPAIAPRGRYGFGMSYDSLADQAIVFGGWTITGNYNNDTWVYNITSNNWTRMDPLPSPSTRNYLSMVYDAEAERTILFGGHDNGVVRGDIWSYNYRDIERPRILGVSPINGTKDLPLAPKISISWSRPMNQSSAENATSMTPTIPCKWSWQNLNMTCTASVNLQSNTTHTVTISTSAKDIYDARMKRPYKFNFTTIETTSPNISGTTPKNGAIGVPSDVKISIQWSEWMNHSSAESAFYPLPSIGCAWSWSQSVQTCTPASLLQIGVKYSVAISTAAKDIAGNHISTPYTFSFTILENPPTVNATIPKNGSMDVPLNTNIVLTFNRPMDRASTEVAISTYPVIVSSYQWSAQNTTITITPDEPLRGGTIYTVTVAKSAKSSEGFELKENFTFTFKTMVILVTTSPDFVPAATGVIIAIVAAIIVIFSIESAIYVVSLLLIPLYTKIRKEKLLDNFLRGQIFEFIRENPGAHLRMIKSELKLQMGVLCYHLKVLQKGEMVSAKNDMNLKRFYQIPKERPSARPALSDIQKKIVAEIDVQPGMRAINLAKHLGISHSLALYNLRRVCEMGHAVPRNTSQGVKYYTTGKNIMMIGDENPAAKT